MKKRTLNELIAEAVRRGEERYAAPEIKPVAGIEHHIAEVKALAAGVPDEVIERMLGRDPPFITKLRGVLGPEIDDKLLRRFVEFAVGLEHDGGPPSSFTLCLDIVAAIRGNPTWGEDELPYLESIERIQRVAAAAWVDSGPSSFAVLSGSVWAQERAATLYRLARLRVLLAEEFGDL